jgi:positive phototaxis protein PixI
MENDMPFTDAAAANSAIDTIDSMPAQPPSSEMGGESFLRFYLTSNLPCLLSVHQMAEVLTLSFGQVMPMFEMPAWVMGIYNWRGEVLWVVDLNHFLGLTPWYQQEGYGSKHIVVILQSSHQANNEVDSQAAVLGLVVNRVEDMVLCASESIRPLLDRQVSPEIQPFLRGCWQDPTGELKKGLNWVLEGTAILGAMPH